MHGSASAIFQKAEDRLRRIVRWTRKARQPFRVRRAYGPNENWITSTTAVFRGRFLPRKTVLFFPSLPDTFHVAYKACVMNGYRMTADVTKKYNLVHVHDDVTFSEYQDAPWQAGMPVLNSRSTDISKSRVQDVFEEVFGYSLKVDPREHQGRAVRKSNSNYRHDGSIVQCPYHEPEEADVVYQRLVETDLGDGYCLDHRVPIIDGQIPLVYLKYRPIDNRFLTFDRAEITEPSAVFSPDEVELILELADRMGVEFGEMDVLRDNRNGRIFVVDVNDTPSGPPKKLGDAERRYATLSLASAYREMVDRLSSAGLSSSPVSKQRPPVESA
jgi:hypothetical protein